MRLAEYDTMYQAEDHHWWYRHLRALLRLYWQRHVHATRPALLDCGCGTGANLQAFAGDCGFAAGLDYSMRAVELSRARGLTHVLRGDTCRIPFSDEVFDVAFSCDILVNGGVTDPQGALEEIRRVLRPGGILIINLAAYQWLLSSHDVAVHNVRRFTRAQLRRMLETAGFDVIEATYWNTLLFPPIALVRLLRKFQRRDGSDLNDGTTCMAATLLKTVLGWELRCLRKHSLPFGLSVMAVARKPVQDDVLSRASVCPKSAGAMERGVKSSGFPPAGVSN